MTMTAGAAKGAPAWQQGRTFGTDTEERLEELYDEDVELYPEDQFPISVIRSEFSRATYFLGQAVDHLIRAANEAEHWHRHQQIDALIEKLDDDFSYEMSQVLKQLEVGA